MPAMTQRSVAVASLAAVAFVAACCFVSPDVARDGIPLMLAPARLLVPFFGRMAGVIDALVATPIAAAEALATLPFYVTAYVTGAATTGQILSAAGAAAALVTAAPALGSVARLALEFFSKVGLWAAVRALASALKFLGPVCGFHLCFCMHVVTFFTPVDSGAWPHTAIAFDAAAHILAASQLAWSLGRLPGASRAVTHLALAAFGASTLAASATYHSSSAHLGFAAVACAWAAGVFALEEWPAHVSGGLAAPGADAARVASFLSSACVALPFAVANLLIPGPGGLPDSFKPFAIGGQVLGSYAMLAAGLWVTSMARCRGSGAGKAAQSAAWVHAWGWWNLLYIALRFGLADAHDVGARAFGVAFALIKAGEFMAVVRGPMWVLGLAASVALWTAGRYADGVPYLAPNPWAGDGAAGPLPHLEL